MDGRGRFLDNIFIERWWRSVKYEDIYLRAYDTPLALHEGLRNYFGFYNGRPRQRRFPDDRRRTRRISARLGAGRLPDDDDDDGAEGSPLAEPPPAGWRPHPRATPIFPASGHEPAPCPALAEISLCLLIRCLHSPLLRARNRYGLESVIHQRLVPEGTNRLAQACQCSSDPKEPFSHRTAFAVTQLLSNLTRSGPRFRRRGGRRRRSGRVRRRVPANAGRSRPGRGARCRGVPLLLTSRGWCCKRIATTDQEDGCQNSG